MQCKDVEVVLEQEGLASLPDAAEKHLAGCTSCQDLLADLTKIVAAAHELPAEVEPPARSGGRYRVKKVRLAPENVIDDPDAPKYINTPQTLLYDKSNHVYGLHLAKESVRKSKYVVIAEGNLDVISSHQVGVRQVVATAGTALT